MSGVFLLRKVIQPLFRHGLLFFRCQDRVESGASFVATGVVLADQSGITAQVNDEVNVWRPLAIGGREVGFQAISPLLVSNDRCPMGIVVGTARTCLPEFEAGPGERAAVCSGANRAREDITAADLAA